MIFNNSSAKEISLYIHWPFCLSKCPYCDFNSHEFNEVSYSLWQESYLTEIGYFSSLLENKRIKSIFFGGGTPSLMPAFLVEGIINKISQLGYVDSQTEITLEANPTSVESSKFADFRNAGVNRVSLGIQSFNEEDLKFLGRKHSNVEAIKSIEIAARYFDNYSFDLIYARPGQTLKGWQTELELAMSMVSKHISLYQLTIEKGTKFYSMYHKGQFKLPDHNQASELYDLTNDILEQNGYYRYEISNYAVQGFESKHNLNYWDYGDYLGVGPGAHSRISFMEEQKNKMQALETVYNPSGWTSAVKNNGHGIRKFEVLSFSDVAKEILMMGLRLTKGFEENVLMRFTNKQITELVDTRLIDILLQEEFLVIEDGIIKLTTKGIALHNQIIYKLFDRLLVR